MRLTKWARSSLGIDDYCRLATLSWLIYLALLCVLFYEMAWQMSLNYLSRLILLDFRFWFFPTRYDSSAPGAQQHQLTDDEAQTEVLLNFERYRRFSPLFC